VITSVAVQTYAALENQAAHLVLPLSTQMNMRTTNTVRPWRPALLALPQVCTICKHLSHPTSCRTFECLPCLRGTVFYTLVPHIQCHCICGVVASLFLYLVSLHLMSLHALSCYKRVHYIVHLSRLVPHIPHKLLHVCSDVISLIATCCCAASSV